MIGALAIGVGTTVELSRVRGLGSRLQDAVDGAALNASKVAVLGGDDAAVLHAAQSQVSISMSGQRGVTTPAVTAQVVSRSPVRVKVEASSAVSLVLGGLFGRDTSEVDRAATAESQMDPLCILLLEPTAAQAWTAGGSSQVIGTGCAAHVNSTSPGALASNGGAGATMKAILTGGTVTGASSFKPAAISNQPPLVDPIAPRITWPTPSSCDVGKNNLSITAPKALTPGVYCNGLSIGNGGVATMAPGVHVIRTGDLTIKSGGKLLAPLGVTIVLISDTSVVDLQAGGTADIRAPMSGSWRGIAVAQKPQPTEKISTMQGGGELLFDGIIYLPSQKLRLTGGGDLSVVGQRRVYVSRKLETAGNGKVHVNGDPTLMSETARVRIVQ